MSMCLSSLAAAGEALVHRLRAVAAVLVVCRKQPASPWMSLVLVAAVFTRSQWAVAAQQEAPIRPCRGRVPIRCLMLAGHRPLQRAVVAAATRNTPVASLAAGPVVLVAAAQQVPQLPMAALVPLDRATTAEMVEVDIPSTLVAVEAARVPLEQTVPPRMVATAVLAYTTPTEQVALVITEAAAAELATR